MPAYHNRLCFDGPKTQKNGIRQICCDFVDRTQFFVYLPRVIVESLGLNVLYAEEVSA